MKRLYKFDYAPAGGGHYQGLLLIPESEKNLLVGKRLPLDPTSNRPPDVLNPITEDNFEEVPVPMIEYIEWLELELMSDDRESVLGGAEPGDSFGFDPREHVM